MELAAAGLGTATTLPTWLGQGHQKLLQDPLSGSPVNVMIDATGIKSASKRRKCVIFDIDPQLHVDNAKSATIEDIISAEMSMLESMLLVGIPVSNMIKHIRSLTDKGKVYIGSALVKYDLAIWEKAEIMGPTACVWGS